MFPIYVQPSYKRESEIHGQCMKMYIMVDKQKQ